MKHKKKVFLVGNPNVGKSTVFNEITGSHQHTGNWSGKTVEVARGEYYYKFNDYEIIDLPGTYSLLTTSEEERLARDYLCFEQHDCVVCVVDATALQRNLNLVLQVLELTSRVVVLLNLCDEAKKKNINIDTDAMEKELGVPVVRATARSGRGINQLLEQVHLISNGVLQNDVKHIEYCNVLEAQLPDIEKVLKYTVDSGAASRFFALRLIEGNDGFNSSFCENYGENILNECPLGCILQQAKRNLDNAGIDKNKLVEHMAFTLFGRAEAVSKKSRVHMPSRQARREALLDKILLGKYTSVISMLIVFGIVLWITMVLSNYPSQLLQALFGRIEQTLASCMDMAGVPEIWVSLLVGGILRVLFWVIAVMLPPMAIFFPLFALLEDFGVLPRLAFNLDSSFEACGGCGKQALTTCMGYGCNAVGITGCRIIDSPRERLVAIITNSLSPCNGRFPLLIAIISMFIAKNSVVKTLILLAMILLSLMMTFLSSKVLTSTVLRGEKSSFVLELPPYRKPQILRLAAETVREKILFVLGRAVVIAAPAGLAIWLLANIKTADGTLLSSIALVLDPIGKFIGLDGVMLFAFILGFPANER